MLSYKNTKFKPKGKNDSMLKSAHFTFKVKVMHHTSLIEILRTFTRDEIKKFDDFVNSPYHNKKSTVANLYHHIKKYAPAFKSQRLEKEKVWKVLFPDKEYNYGILKNLIFTLTNCAENFISLENFQKQDVKKKYELLDSLYNREIINLFLKKYNTLIKNINTLQKNKKINFDTFSLMSSKMFGLKLDFSMDHEPHSGIEEEFKKYINSYVSLFLYNFFSISVKNISFYTYYNQKEKNIIDYILQNKEFNILIIELMEYVKSISPEVYNILEIYYKYYISHSEHSSIEKYSDFKDVLIANAKNLHKSDLFNLYEGLHNSTIFLNLPENKLNQEILEICKLRVKYEAILNPDGVLEVAPFVGSIHTAFNLKDSDFIENFVEKFIKFTPRCFTENLQKFSSAHLYFLKNKFDKSLEEILTMNYDILYFKYSLRNLRAMNYFELNDYNSFLLLFDSYKHFISKDLSGNERFKTKGKLLFNEIKNLFKLRENFNELDLKNLKSQIINTPTIIRRQWLLEKIEELEKSRKNLSLLK